MAKFRPIKKHGTGLERWKDEKTGKERRRTGWLIQRKIGKSGKTRFWKEKKRKKTGKRKIFFKRERVSFRSRSNKFWPAHISRWRVMGCCQSGGSEVIETKPDWSGTNQARCLVTRTPPSRNGGGVMLWSGSWGRLIERYKGVTFPNPTALVALWGKGIGLQCTVRSRGRLLRDAISNFWLPHFTKHGTQHR